MENKLRNIYKDFGCIGCIILIFAFLGLLLIILMHYIFNKNTWKIIFLALVIFGIEHYLIECIKSNLDNKWLQFILVFLGALFICLLTSFSKSSIQDPVLGRFHKVIIVLMALVFSIYAAFMIIDKYQQLLYLFMTFLYSIYLEDYFLKKYQIYLKLENILRGFSRIYFGDWCEYFRKIILRRFFC